MGYVYLILQVNIEGTETYKIGITKNPPEKRLKQLQTGNSDKLTLLKYYKSENYLKVERTMHRLYASRKTESKNEWFALEDEHILSFLVNAKKPMLPSTLCLKIIISIINLKITHSTPFWF
jgi:hypothetical protein